MAWAKGYWELIDMLAKHKTDLDGFNLEVYGNGEDAHEVQSTAKRLNLDVNVMKVVTIQMILFMVLRSVLPWPSSCNGEIWTGHRMNFSRYSRTCLTYMTPEDFVAKFKEVMSGKPQSLTPEEQYKLSWEAATQRFMEYSDLDKVFSSETSLYRRHQKGMWKSVSMPNLD